MQKKEKEITIISSQNFLKIKFFLGQTLLNIDPDIIGIMQLHERLENITLIYLKMHCK